MKYICYSLYSTYSSVYLAYCFSSFLNHLKKIWCLVIKISIYCCHFQFIKKKSLSFKFFLQFENSQMEQELESKVECLCTQTPYSSKYPLFASPVSRFIALYKVIPISVGFPAVFLSVTSLVGTASIVFCINCLALLKIVIKNNFFVLKICDLDLSYWHLCLDFFLPMADLSAATA